MIPTLASAQAQTDGKVELRAWGAPGGLSDDVESLANLEVMEAFQHRYPRITPVPSTGLKIPGGGSRTMDMVPLMQIAGDIPPHVLYVVFRSSETYIQNKLLYPLDKYIEQDTLKLNISNGPLLELNQYLAALKQSPHYQMEIEGRVPPQCWTVMRRECPYQEECHFCEAWGVPPRKRHFHVWAFPQGPVVTALFYRKDLFSEAGLPDRVPETTEEMLEWARKLTDPKKGRYGLKIGLNNLGWSTLSFLYSLDGRLVEQDVEGNWRCAFDSAQAVEAYYFVARLFHEPFVSPSGELIDSVVSTGAVRAGTREENAMFMGAIYQNFSSSETVFDMALVPFPKDRREREAVSSLHK